jgi:hypothetical protein
MLGHGQQQVQAQALHAGHGGHGLAARCPRARTPGRSGRAATSRVFAHQVAREGVAAQAARAVLGEGGLFLPERVPYCDDSKKASSPAFVPGFFFLKKGAKRRSGAWGERGLTLRRMLWVKAFHIVFVASWFAGLFYLPRIFVNLAMVAPDSVAERERLAADGAQAAALHHLLAVPAWRWACGCGWATASAAARAMAGCTPSWPWWCW